MLQFDTSARSVTGLPLAFECSWTSEGLGAAWVQVAGELDLATAPELARILRGPGLQARLVMLDLRELAFISCSGVHAIVDASIRARDAGRRLVLLRAAPNVKRLFTLTGSEGDVEFGNLEFAS